jgi:hypothetical protein
MSMEHVYCYQRSKYSPRSDTVRPKQSSCETGRAIGIEGRNLYAVQDFERGELAD